MRPFSTCYGHKQIALLISGGEFLAHQRNVVLVGGTGTGKTHLAIAIARACIRDGPTGQSCHLVRC